MTRTTDRRAEAHLWLALEEALASARAGGDERAAFDARRAFSAVADALVVVGAIDNHRAKAVVSELHDALAVRGLGRDFTGREFPRWNDDDHPVRRRGDGWLEAEIEHHLDLVVDLAATGSPQLAQRMLHVLGPPARALQAVGSLPQGHARLADVAATFRAAGFPVDAPHGQPDHGWLGFLRDRPAPLTDKLEPVATVETDVVVGTFRDQPIRITSVAWSEHLLQVEIAGYDGSTVDDIRPWRCSVFDDAGRLHLGQPGGFLSDGRVRFRLRPGLMAGVKSMSVRVTRGAERMEEQVWL